MSRENPTPRAPTESAFSYAAYLTAKKTVDDRALNRQVVDVFRRELATVRSPRVLEVGAGVGTMVARLAEWNVIARAEYTLLDVDQESLAEAVRWLSHWADSTGRSARRLQEDTLHIAGGSPAVDITVHTVCADLGESLRSHDDGRRFDVVIANAFLDLVDIPATLPALFERLTPNGLYWFSINFDGETIFLPEHAADAALMGAYHRSMDERVRAGKRAGDSRAGRHLFQHLPAAGARILASGSSDWLVHAIDGKYPAREAEFVEQILHTIDAELSRRDDVDPASLRAWLSTRREQLARAELVYIAHQLDFVGRLEPA